MNIWYCKIGETDFHQNGMDWPMRQALREAYIKLTGEEPKFIFSGWGQELDEIQRQVVNEAEAMRSGAESKPSSSRVL